MAKAHMPLARWAKKKMEAKKPHTPSEPISDLICCAVQVN
jgi:hypothetical protein